MAGGYMGKILNVDLSNDKIEVEALDERTCRDFIGGPGLAAVPCPHKGYHSLS